MFGLEKGKKEGSDEFFFDLEKELKQVSKHKEIIALVESRIQEVKKILRAGEDQGNFDQYGALLHGYTALLKVASRVTPKV